MGLQNVDTPVLSVACHCMAKCILLIKCNLLFLLCRRQNEVSNQTECTLPKGKRGGRLRSRCPSLQLVLCEWRREFVG